MLRWWRNQPGFYLDATVGLGGHAEAFLETTPVSFRLLGVDRDPEALSLSGQRLKKFGDRLRLMRGNFCEADKLLKEGNWLPLQGALWDLGVSSLQLEDASRGFPLQR